MHCASPNSIRARIFIVLALMCFMLYEILIINCKCKAFTHLEAFYFDLIVFKEAINIFLIDKHG